jgi:hypothetical protein
MKPSARLGTMRFFPSRWGPEILQIHRNTLGAAGGLSLEGPRKGEGARELHFGPGHGITDLHLQAAHPKITD